MTGVTSRAERREETTPCSPSNCTLLQRSLMREEHPTVHNLMRDANIGVWSVVFLHTVTYVPKGFCPSYKPRKRFGLRCLGKDRKVFNATYSDCSTKRVPPEGSFLQSTSIVPDSRQHFCALGSPYQLINLEGTNLMLLPYGEVSHGVSECYRKEQSL